MLVFGDNPHGNAANWCLKQSVQQKKLWQIITIDNVSKAYLFTAKDQDEDLRRNLQGVGCHQLRGDRPWQVQAGTAGICAAVQEPLPDLGKGDGLKPKLCLTQSNFEDWHDATNFTLTASPTFLSIWAAGGAPHHSWKDCRKIWGSLCHSTVCWLDSEESNTKLAPAQDEAQYIADEISACLINPQLWEGILKNSAGLVCQCFEQVLQNLLSVLLN